MVRIMLNCRNVAKDKFSIFICNLVKCLSFSTHFKEILVINQEVFLNVPTSILGDNAYIKLAFPR